MRVPLALVVACAVVVVAFACAMSMCAWVTAQSAKEKRIASFILVCLFVFYTQK